MQNDISDHQLQWIENELSQELSGLGRKMNHNTCAQKRLFKWSMFCGLDPSGTQEIKESMKARISEH